MGDPVRVGEGIYQRIKRFIFELITIVVVAVIGIPAGYTLTKTFSGSSNVESVAETNLANIKSLANETHELEARYDLLLTHLNFSVKQISDINDRVRNLELVNSLDNQAIIATLVSQSQLTSSQLK